MRLAEEDSSLAAHSREMTGEITAAERAIRPHVPLGMRLEQFLALPADPDSDLRIADQQRTVAAVRQAKEIAERRPLTEVAVPNMPAGFADLLARTIDDIAQDAEIRLTEHLAVHGMQEDGGNWIAKGLEHADDGICPFCGQDIVGLPLIEAYRAIFSDRYQALRNDIASMRDEIADQFDEAALGRLSTLVEQNKGAIEFWGATVPLTRG